MFWTFTHPLLRQKAEKDTSILLSVEQCLTLPVVHMGVVLRDTASSCTTLGALQEAEVCTGHLHVVNDNLFMHLREYTRALPFATQPLPAPHQHTFPMGGNGVFRGSALDKTTSFLYQE